MFFRSILAKWKESVDILRWSNLKLLLLVSLKSFVNALKLAVIYYGWFFILAAVSYVVLANSTQRSWTPFFIICLDIVASFILILILRPSLERKKCEYFRNYSKRFCGFTLTFFISSVIRALFILPVLYSQTIASHTSLTQTSLIQTSLVIYNILVVGFSWLPHIAGLFYLDTHAGLKQSLMSVAKSVKAVVCFYPAFFMLGVVELAVNSVFIESNSLPVIYFLFAINNLSKLFILGVVVNLYAKLKHNNYDLFFGNGTKDVS